ncbi:hypothetical protein ASPZODRAFT_25153 [Penicilliopsis zonata CBS 506.65]|uniref:Phosphoglycerate mutase family protein n=1 Tax=Penicilliopsis zonata CBS 506.65 TaxID=1073090 RepID=A0A1L9SIN0_9EURO|nr:hypothetical protein ASPZODRAFT_25153 [Penicilliopsis zonata CBS 506.65]OJJ47075.1 hypothetical protein ASPZODRAFT_25153 [Penicilliopsis zonata CBS 506.65]
MKLFLIRHAECPQNVGKAAAGADGTSLTYEGESQASALARHFRDRLVRFTHVFTSDLDRARQTAEGICQQQLGGGISPIPVATAALREQQSGLDNGRWWRAPSTYEEPLESMQARANGFVWEKIIPPLLGGSSSPSQEDEAIIAVIAHGVILQVLWACIVDLFETKDIRSGPNVQQPGMHGDPLLPVWSNTGYLELEISPSGLNSARVPLVSGTATTAAPLVGWTLTIHAVDCTVHLDGGRSGIAPLNPAHESRQQSLDDFYRLVGST